MTQRHLRAICVAVRDGHVFSNVDGQSTLTPTGGGATGGDGGGKNSRVSAPVGRSTRATHSAYAARSSAVVTTVVEQSGTLAATEVVTATEYRDASQLEAPEPNACCTAVAISDPVMPELASIGKGGDGATEQSDSALCSLRVVACSRRREFRSSSTFAASAS